MKRVLAIDYGKKRVGLALSDAAGIIASPFDTLANNGRADLIKAIKEIVTLQQVGEVVVGLPYYPDGKESAQTQEVRGFILKLESELTVAVIAFDESYSSVEAERRVEPVKPQDLKSNSYKKLIKRKEKIDRIAAAIILQNYLDGGRNEAVLSTNRNK